MFRMPAQPRWRRVGNGVKRIGAAGVGRQAVVIKVDLKRVGIVNHILNHRAKARGGGINLGLRFSAQIDGLGIAATLKVEGAAIRPAMFIIADQRAIRSRRKRGFPGARQAKEHRGIDRIARRMVGRAMHRHHAFFRQQIVQQGKNRLLVFTRIGGIADQDQMLVEIHRDDG